MAAYDDKVARAGGHRRFNVGQAAHSEHDTAHDPDHTRNFGYGNGDDDDQQAGFHQSDEGNRQQDGRNGHQPVHDPHHDVVDAAIVAAQHTYDDAKSSGNQGYTDADDERDPGAVDDAVVNVAAKLIGTKPELGRRTLETIQRFKA